VSPRRGKLAPVPTVRTFTTAEATADLLRELKTLVTRAFEPEHFTDDDWDHALGGWHAVVVDDDRSLLAHAAVVARMLDVDDRPMRAGYAEGVATAAGRHNEGHGSRAMEAINDIVRREFEMGALSTGRHSFYERLGWERWRGPTYVRENDTLVRTEEEDDGIMVLRHGPSSTVDLSARLTCEARAGDDW
jgi:aminoglycoside 2'-N-acetyltransferase I